MIEMNPETSWYSSPGPDFDVVFSSRVRLSRCLAHTKFPAMMSLEEQRTVDEQITEGIDRLPRSLTSAVLGEWDELDRRMLVERKLVSPNFSLNPDRICFFNDDQTLSGMVNGIDHLRTSFFAPGFSLKQAGAAVFQFDEELEQELSFAVSTEFGYLNSEVINCGTGMKASVLVHLPGIREAGLLEETLESLTRVGVEIKGILEEDQDETDLYQLANPFGIGFPEEKILANLENMVTDLVRREREARWRIHEENSLWLEDQVGRALGILENARLLDYQEALNQLQILRLGASLSIVPVSMERITRLIYTIQNAHVRSLFPDREMEPEGVYINEKRASIIRERLKKLPEEADSV